MSPKPPRLRTASILLYVCIFFSCQYKDAHPNEPDQKTMFTLLPADQTHVDFNNTIVESERVNIMSYQYFYNGGGVATGDLNNDGLEDVYFSANMAESRLYLNKGKMVFDDITVRAGITEPPVSWKTGVTMADVNGDGKLDIYQCYSGGLPEKSRKNTLFINQGNDAQGIPVFKEQAAEYGLADPSYSTQAVFFDYDKDGDLDMFLLNHNPKSFTTLDEVSAPVILKEPAPMICVKLYRNDKGTFSDVSAAAGLYNSSFTYGLGAGVADVNGDGWPDIYISNDYSSPDYLYINNGNGSFSNQIRSQIGHTSLYSMGNDIADVNNDGLADILTLDMLPESNHRQKQLFAPDNYEYYDLRLKLGFHYQDMRNMLQINNGNGTFSEVGQLSGISNTDWSWAPLFADYDNDGWKDLFISNGYMRDFTDMDFLKYKGDFLRNTDPAAVRQNLLGLISNMPSSNVNNYIFRNNGNLTFSNKGQDWGMNIPSNSNGAAYADLDNDGDLDLVINNINLPAFIYQNHASEYSKNQYLKVKLAGADQNTQGIGARIWLFSKGRQQYLEQSPTRGYQSGVSPVLHFGLGNGGKIDSLKIVWAGGKQQILNDVRTNQVLLLSEKNAKDTYQMPKPVSSLFKEVKSPIAFSQKKNAVNDFKRQPLVINPLSFSGPCMVKGDVNEDGLEDVYIGGAQDQSAELYIQSKNGTFSKKVIPAFITDKHADDTDALFFDSNGDGFMDLYVVSGGCGKLSPDDVLFQDRLYINDGKGNFRKNLTALPKMSGSKSCVRSGDINGDGYPDLFVGGRVVPGSYPEAPQSYLLINDGKGHFTDQISVISPELQKIGMVSDAAWLDINGDQHQDLMVIGEWMPLTVLCNENGKLKNKTTDYFDRPYNGWWNKLMVQDLNGDGNPDLVVGNFGLNSQCKVSEKEPAELYYKDFDDNGSVDPIFCFYIQGKSYPYVTRDELLDQMSMMRTRYADYKSYADGTMKDIFTAEELQGAAILKIDELKTMVFMNNGKGNFKATALPIQAQYAPVYTINSLDFDHDGHLDLLLCGNISRAKLKFGKNDANYGVLLKGNGQGSFSYIPQQQSGFALKGDIRSTVQIKDKIYFGINQSAVIAYSLK